MSMRQASSLRDAFNLEKTLSQNRKKVIWVDSKPTFGTNFPRNHVFFIDNVLGKPPLIWETATTSVDIEDESAALLCEVVFSFALDQGVVLKDTKANGCASK